jgi:hypothetical protein
MLTEAECPAATAPLVGESDAEVACMDWGGGDIAAVHGWKRRVARFPRLHRPEGPLRSPRTLFGSSAAVLRAARVRYSHRNSSARCAGLGVSACAPAFTELGGYTSQFDIEILELFPG